MHVLAILMSFQRHVTFLMIILICLQDNLSSPGVDKLLHFEIALINSSSENSFYLVIGLLGISSNNFMLI